MQNLHAKSHCDNVIRVQLISAISVVSDNVISDNVISVINKNIINDNVICVYINNVFCVIS